jgi:hypothetical protein
MPSSPDLEVVMEIENDGYKTQKTLSGGTITNIRHTGAPLWYNQQDLSNPFSVNITQDGLGLGKRINRQKTLHGAKRNGRRTWSVSFSFIEDKDVFSSNYSENNYLQLDGNISDYVSDGVLNNDANQFDFDLFSDDSFIAQVWNKTLGGALPFIFQPDSNNNQSDQFCIAMFDMDTIEITQKAYKHYEIRLKIREVW